MSDDALQMNLFPVPLPRDVDVGDKIETERMPDSSELQPKTAKALGAFYTDSQVADFLVWWAVRSPDDTVLDPSFGGGVFLRSAAERLARLGGAPAVQLYGVEIEGAIHRSIADKVNDEFGVRHRNLLNADFFECDGRQVSLVDTVVGNPPFIRYQRFTGDTRRRALAKAALQGVKLSELSSSWVPFLVHATGFLKPGGRLAMVAPFELTHAGYAQPLLEFLSRSFQQVVFLTFRKKLFPDLSEDTLLVLAEDRGADKGRFLLRDLAHPGSLFDFVANDRRPLPGLRAVDTSALTSAGERLVEYFISPKARALYHSIRASSAARGLGQLADVGIGYVTGANEFFHLNTESARRWRIPDAYLRPAVRRARAFAGLHFTRPDWKRTLECGEAGYLLHLGPEKNLPPEVLRYLEAGERMGIPKAYKCRTRSPWYRVPHVYQPDAFLTYMSGEQPQFVTNDASAVAPNTFHVVRLRPDSEFSSDTLAALWQTSLTRLSVELEGHALGGGMLKLEPGEAQRVALACPGMRPRRLEELAAELDRLLRRGDAETARQLADRTILREAGLSKLDCQVLADAATVLKQRRYARNGEK